MSVPNWGEWSVPDLSHAADREPLLWDDGTPIRDDAGCRRRAFIPDPLTIVIAAEGGRPILYPIFPVGEPFAPDSDCPHNGPLPDGSAAYCPVCHDTGLRDHPAVRMSPNGVASPPSAAAMATAEPTRYRGAPTRPTPETRRQKRQRRRPIQGTIDARDLAESA